MDPCKQPIASSKRNLPKFECSNVLTKTNLNNSNSKFSYVN